MRFGRLGGPGVALASARSPLATIGRPSGAAENAAASTGVREGSAVFPHMCVPPTDPRASSRVRCRVIADLRALFDFRSVLLFVHLLPLGFLLVPVPGRGLTG